MTNSYETATEILEVLQGDSVSAGRLQAALAVAVLGFGDLSDRSDPRQVADDVLMVVRSALLDDVASPSTAQLRRVV